MRLILPLSLALGAIGIAAAPGGGITRDDSPKKAAPRRQKDNSLCYVCHLDLEKEEIAAVHLKSMITCAGCHGLSYDHMHDEMLMTTPDRLYGRAQVNEMCRRCHDDHENPEKVNAFLEKWRGRDRPNGRVITESSICTDCHGLHNIVKKMGSAKDEEEKPAQWITAFNGEDLTGWRPSGGNWIVRRGRIVGTPGEGGGDLWGERTYRNFLLSVTFQGDWPIHGGIWMRGEGLRIEIFKRGPAYPGSLLVGKKGLALLNLQDDLYDEGGWNTISAEVRGDRIRIWLNGKEIGAVMASVQEKGRIGFHLEGGSEYRSSSLSIREVLVQELPEEKEGSSI